MPFSIAALEATGEAFPIGEEASEPSLAADGTSTYISGGGQHQLVCRDREGGKIGAIGQPEQDLRYPSLSPDDRHEPYCGDLVTPSGSAYPFAYILARLYNSRPN